MVIDNSVPTLPNRRRFVQLRSALAMLGIDPELCSAPVVEPILDHDRGLEKKTRVSLTLLTVLSFQYGNLVMYCTTVEEYPYTT